MITEIHVRGATKLNFHLPEHLRGTYLGLCHPFMIDFFKKTGVDKLQLMPVMEFHDESRLIELGLTNYWGYNPCTWLYPTTRYACDPENVVAEFKTMVYTLQKNGIKVILDVVYNHVAEGVRNDYPHWNEDYCGCGATVKLEQCVNRVIESLKKWRNYYKVDGFRFDLATALGRDNEGAFNPESELITSIQNDPGLSGCILIAEPWDCETYQLGNFPQGWQECSDQYRQCIRKFFKGTETIGNLAKYLTGSQNTYRPWQSKRPINYITYHDGFTLQDLVSYDEKQNHANKECNRDGCSNNANWSRYLEGDTPEMTSERREAAKRNMMTTLLYSLGEPHILFADLFSHSQQGNNNAYCQDNEISWVNWDFDSKEKRDFYEFMVGTIRDSQEVMPAFNNAVGDELEYTWNCPDWSARQADLVLKVGLSKLIYRITDSNIDVRRVVPEPASSE